MYRHPPRILHLGMLLPVLLALLPLPLWAYKPIPRLTLALPAAIEQLNPLTNFLADAATVNDMLYCSLLRPDKATGEYLPFLALAHPKESPDHTTFTYYIHPAAKFNNGNRITSADVVFTVKLLKNPHVNNAESRIQYARIADVTALDEQAVVFRLTEPTAEALRITSEFAVFSEEVFDPEHKLAAISVPQLNQPDKLNPQQQAALRTVASRANTYGSAIHAFAEGNACGPYIVTEWKVGDLITLEANPRFWGRKVESPNPYLRQNVQTIQVRTLRDEASLRLGLSTGEIDIASGVAPDAFARFSVVPTLQARYNFLSPPGNAYEYIGLNMRSAARGRNGILDDRSTRQAIAYLIPVERLLQEVRKGQGRRIAADCSAPDPDFLNTSLQLVPHDPEKALRLLAAAGWRDRNGDGLLDNIIAGQEAPFILQCIVNENRPYRIEIANRLQEAALELGMIISIQTLPWSTYLERLRTGDFDLYIGSWFSDPNEDSYAQVWHTASIADGSNFVGFGNAKTDALIEEYDRSFSKQRRKEISLDIQRIQAEEQPYVFLWQETNSLIVKNIYNNDIKANGSRGFWIPAFGSTE